MNIEEYVLYSFQTHFAEYKNKNIVIYGTRRYTKVILDHYTDYNILGLMDGFKTDGEIYGKPILAFDDVLRLKIDLIVVVANRNNLQIIYKRIRDFCYFNQISLYGINGKNLFDIFGVGFVAEESLVYFQFNENDLIKLIDSHDIVSFDVFDTLIMRRTLYPTDVFDLVQAKAKEQGIHIPEFKKIRIKAEIENPNQSSNIHNIYNYLQMLTSISDDEKNQLLQLEITVEKQVIIRREKMVEMFFYALKTGKKVYLISDMYLSRRIIDGILSHLGIYGYDDIFVSCDMGLSKGNGLFDIFKEKVNGNAYLHIGDNEFSDGISAEKSGIDPFLIKSAANMLHMSAYNCITKYLRSVNDRSLAGLVISKVFNDPFRLHGTYGRPVVTQVSEMGYLFIGAIITNYILWLIKELENGDYDDILFSARDGFLIRKLYDIALKKLSLNDISKGIYFLVSRKLSSLASMDNEEDIIWIAQRHDLHQPEMMLQKRFDLEKDEILPYDEEKYLTRAEYALAHKDIIFKKSAQTRKNYLMYMENLGLRPGKKYALFDFHAGGTSQYFLSKVTPYHLEGVYLCRYHLYGEKIYDVIAKSLFENHSTYSYETYFSGHYLFLETIITSFEPSVNGMGENGAPIYNVEERSKSQLDVVREMQESIEDFFNDYIDYLYIKDQNIYKELSDMILNLMDEVYTDERCDILDEIMLMDDLGSLVLETKRKQWAG